MRALLVLLLVPALAAADGAPAYFPLEVGNWWAYEELDEDGTRLSRETWAIVGEAHGERRPDEFLLQSSTKRLDLLGRRRGRRWHGREYLRRTAVGVEKRYPAERDVEIAVLLVKEPVASGTSWHDAQGDCEVRSCGPCRGPRGDVPECATVVCRLGEPTVTIVTSTYARGIGMVRQEIDVLQLLPGLRDAGSVSLPSDGVKGGHSLMRLTAFHVMAP
jgi:hypothetical protein